MLALAVILIAFAALVTGFVVLGAPDPATCATGGSCSTFELGGIRVTMDPLWVFLTGAAAVLLLVLGLELLRAAARRARRRRHDRKELARRAERLESHEAMHARDEAATSPMPTQPPPQAEATGDTEVIDPDHRDR